MDGMSDTRMIRAMAGERVILVGCVKLKQDRPAPAKDLYRSTLWQRRRRYAEASGCLWLILSAKYGLLDPEKRIQPYDLALGQLSAKERRSWGDQVVRQLEDRLGAIAGTTFEVHAGAPYVRSIEPGIVQSGGRISAPLAHLGQGKQLAWYTASEATSSRRRSMKQRRRIATNEEFHAALRALDTAPVLSAARDWPTAARGLNASGLYAWWVDNPGAADLSGGLAGQVTPGRIYGGQAGATKWPSGKAGGATLRSRIFVAAPRRKHPRFDVPAHARLGARRRAGTATDRAEEHRPGGQVEPVDAGAPDHRGAPVRAP
jgi:hypothetical protein